MKKGVLLLIVSATLYVESAPTDSEIVWLKDVSQIIQTDERTLLDPDLPDDLSFHLRRGSQFVQLNLKRNHDIDPNADIYVVRKLYDGRYYQEKSLDLEKEDLAYYQDINNGAFMTVRCVRGINGQCDRVINGNVRIEDANYDLRPAETDITLRDLLDVPDIRGTRYLLRGQGNALRQISVLNKAYLNIFPLSDLKLLPRRVADLDNRDNEKQTYYVEIAVMLDSGMWDLYSSLIQSVHADWKTTIVKRKLRVYFSHIINGVNLLYQGIKDPGISISVTLRTFHIFPTEGDFPHKYSTVNSIDGEGYIDAYLYLKDIARYAKFTKSYSDHLMLFTTHAFVATSTGTKDSNFNGKCFRAFSFPLWLSKLYYIINLSSN
ncbi:hypothetical protein ACJMK2_011134 [Sinanodonta woodiana]|uniref:Uncharacterized protein n=1 Tax=Sinanodonta woodiana TaxID=1069815 RepID=A0ABD3V5U1_SINWO